MASVKVYESLVTSADDFISLMTSSSGALFPASQNVHPVVPQLPKFPSCNGPHIIDIWYAKFLSFCQSFCPVFGMLVGPVERYCGAVSHSHQCPAAFRADRLQLSRHVTGLQKNVARGGSYHPSCRRTVVHRRGTMRADRPRMKAAPESATSTDTDVEQRETLLVLQLFLCAYHCVKFYVTAERSAVASAFPLRAVLLNIETCAPGCSRGI